MYTRICVFCGSSPGTDLKYIKEAETLASVLAEARIDLVYGGGGTGLMGVLARALKDSGGHVTGIVPRALVNDRNIFRVFSELDCLHEVDSYHERKTLMYHLADGFLVLPGGPGTLEELMEHLTWMHRGRRYKPVYIVNLLGYWDPLLQVFGTMAKSGFISEEFSDRYLVCDSVEEAIHDFTKRAVE